MYSCIKCDFIICAIPRKLVCPRCGSELAERAYYVNGDVYQGEKYATIQFMLSMGELHSSR